MNNRFLYVVTGRNYRRYELAENVIYTIGDDIFACNLIIEGITKQLSLELQDKHCYINSDHLVDYSINAGNNLIGIAGEFTSLNDVVLETTDDTSLIITSLDVEQFDDIEQLKLHAINLDLIEPSPSVESSASDQPEVDTDSSDNNEEYHDDVLSNDSPQSDFADLDQMNLSDDKVESTTDVKKADLPSKFYTKLLDNGIFLWVRVKYGVIKERFLSWIKQNRTAFYSVFAIFCILLIAVISFAGVSLFNYSHSKAAQKNALKQGRESKDVQQYFESLNVINLNVRSRNGVAFIGGILPNTTDLTKLTLKVQDTYPDMQFRFQLYNLSDIESNITKLEQKFTLSCDFLSDYSAVGCTGVTANIKSSLDDDINSEYLYEDVLHLQLTLISEKEMSDFMSNLLIADIYKNIHYTIDRNNLMINGYLAQSNDKQLSDAVNTFITRFPFMNVVNKVKDLEKVLQLEISEIRFGQFGNVLVDVHNNAYGVGSVYNGFTINAIQKNYVEVQKGKDRIYVPTPFTDFSAVDSNVSSDKLSLLSDSSKYQAQVKPINIIASKNNGNNSDVIKRQEIQTMMDDVVTKKDILAHLNQERSAANANPKLQLSYDKLIANLSDDVKAEEKEINIYNQTKKN